METKKNYIKPVTYEGTQIIMEQMKKGICKIKNEQNIGTGFFVKYLWVIILKLRL